MRLAVIKAAAGCLGNIRPQFSLGCLEVSHDLAEPEAMLLVGIVIDFSADAGNTVKALEAGLCLYPLCFYAVVGFSGAQIFVLFRAAAGPVNHHTIDFVAQAQAKRYR